MSAGRSTSFWTSSARWLTAGAIVVGLHAGTLFYLTRQDQRPGEGEDLADAIMIDLEPVAVLSTEPVERVDTPVQATPLEPTDPPEEVTSDEPEPVQPETVEETETAEPTDPAIEPVEPEAAEVEPEPVPEEIAPQPAEPEIAEIEPETPEPESVEPEEIEPTEPLETLTPSEDAVTLAAPLPRPRTERPRSAQTIPPTRPRVQQPQQQQPSPPARTAAPQQQQAAPSQPSQAAGISPDAWRGQVNAHLGSFRRQPASSGSGVVRVRFTIDARGQVTGVSVVQSSGYPALDADAVAMVRRASPVPPPPAALLRGGAVSLTVPVNYN